MTTYLNVVEVESAMAALASAHPTLCEVITLPNATFEGRTSHALRIGKTAGAGTRLGILFLGSVHASEWGGADICISFAADLIEAASTGAGLSYGGKSFNAAMVQRIVSKLDVYVFPCVNPDGRAFTQQPSAPWWRKNRNPAASGGDPARIGVDVNRNFDFLWDFATKMDASAPGASADPASINFHGASPGSEPETRNVVWLLDSLPNVGWMMDIHCHKGDVLYSWGDDQDQSDDPTRNFRNPAWDGQRGLGSDAYSEYIRAADLDTATTAVGRFAAALTAVRGTVYAVTPSWDLYPTTGASDDYSFSRHITDATKAKVIAYTLEYGLDSRPEENQFVPVPSVMDEIIREVTAGMLELCLATQPLPILRPPVHWRHLWPWEIWGPYGRRLWGAVILVAVVAIAVVRRVIRGGRR
jgi:murein tripeptide amidase MpaA